MRPSIKTAGIAIAAVTLLGYVGFGIFADVRSTPDPERDVLRAGELSERGRGTSMKLLTPEGHFTLGPVDSVKDAIYLPMSDAEDAAFQPNGVDRITLDPGARYTLRVISGEAYMSPGGAQGRGIATGVTVLYCASDGNDAAIRQAFLESAQSVTFTTPTSGKPWLLAFFLDPYPEDENRGSYTLELTREKTLTYPDASLAERIGHLKQEVADLKRLVKQR